MQDWDHPTAQCRMPHLNNKQGKTTNQLSVGRVTTSHSPAHQRGRKYPPPPPTRTQAQVTPSTLPTQTTEPNLPTESRNQKEKGIRPWSLGKGDLKYNKLKKIIMKRQINTTQMNEQTRNTEVQINEEEIGKVPEIEFRIMIVKMIKNLESKTEKMKASINKDLEKLKKKHAETNNTITEIKNTLEGINSRISEAEE